MSKLYAIKNNDLLRTTQNLAFYTGKFLDPEEEGA